MTTKTPFTPDAGALHAYLVALPPTAPDPVPFTVVRSVSDLPRGDGVRATDLYSRACASCHGDLRSGSRRLATRIPVLPQDTLAAHATFSPAAQRLVFIEKVRHGGFLGYGGDMPPFSRETLADAELSDLLEALGVVGPSVWWDMMPSYVASPSFRRFCRVVGLDGAARGEL